MSNLHAFFRKAGSACLAKVHVFENKHDVNRTVTVPKSEVRAHELLANDIDGFEQ